MSAPVWLLVASVALLPVAYWYGRIHGIYEALKVCVEHAIQTVGAERYVAVGIMKSIAAKGSKVAGPFGRFLGRMGL